MALSVTVHGFMTLTGTQTAGRWGTANITEKDGSDVIVYTVPNVGVDYMILAVSITNRAPATASNVSLAISAEITPRSYEFVEFNSSIVPSGTLERTQIVASPGDKIFLRWGEPNPRNQVRVIDLGIAGVPYPSGITVLPDSTVITADAVNSEYLYLRKIASNGSTLSTAQYTLTNTNNYLAPGTSSNIDTVLATSTSDTFYEFDNDLVNTQDEGFEYGGSSGYENMTITDFRVGGNNDGVGTYDMYKTSNGGGSSHLYTSINIGGDIETGISVVWPGDPTTGNRIKKYTTDNGADTMLSVGWLDSGGGANSALWITALDNLQVDWTSFVGIGNVASPTDSLKPVGAYFYQGYIWILTDDGRLLTIDATDGALDQQFAASVDGAPGQNFDPGPSISGYSSRLFSAVGNTLFWVSTSNDAEQTQTYIWKYTIGQGLSYILNIDHSAVTGSWVPYFLNTTTDRIYLQMQVTENGSDSHSFLYDLADEAPAVTIEYTNGVGLETVTAVNGTVSATSDLDQTDNDYVIPYPTDITSDEVDVATSPLVVSESAPPEIRLIEIEPPGGY